ncbi:hypothetical protein B296_00003691 [Ensete ventricosum]|uniref:Uncharacterized protein n=1 Tax=Ensete ventricosum TaxID=4639 RepID=A0A427B9R6_ENSVE|nr:hypothetical protein B296_00003691 [Ensete ventricosum]
MLGMWTARKRGQQCHLWQRLTEEEYGDIGTIVRQGDCKLQRRRITVRDHCSRLGVTEGKKKSPLSSMEGSNGHCRMGWRYCYCRSWEAAMVALGRQWLWSLYCRGGGDDGWAATFDCATEMTWCGRWQRKEMACGWLQREDVDGASGKRSWLRKRMTAGVGFALSIG